MHLQLVQMRGDERVRTIQRRSAVTLIGRDPGCAVRIDSPEVGGHHCLLYFKDGLLTVEDLASPAGTWVNGRRVKGTEPLRNGDRLSLGPVPFLVEFSETPSAEVVPAEEEPPRVILLPDEPAREPRTVPVAVEQPPTVVAADEAEAEAEVELADSDPVNLPVAETLDGPAADPAGEAELSDAAPSPTASQTAGALGKEAGRFAGTFATDIGKGVGKGLVKGVLGRLLTDLLFQRPWRRAEDPPQQPGQDETGKAPAGARELRPVVRMTCPHCQAPSWTTADRRGTVLLCPRCRQPLQVPRRAPKGTAGEPVPGAAAPRRGWGVRVLGVLLAALLAVAGLLWLSGWWGPLLWQPLQALLRVQHVPKEAAVWVGAVIFAVLGYWLLKLRMVQGISTEVNFLPCRPGDFPRLDRAELVRCTKAFESLGFVRVMDYTSETDRRPAGGGFGRVLVNPAWRCFAEINQIFPTGGRQGPMCFMVLSLFEDGWSLSATNRRMLGAGYMMRRPRSLWTSNPKATPAQLLAGHLKRREAIAADLGLQIRGDLSTEAYFAHVRRGVAGMRRAVWRKNLLVGMIEAKLHDASPHTEWMGEYARLAARKKSR
jgi:hypothetical protein